MKAFVERMLAKVFAVKAHDLDYEKMTSYERQEAAALAAKPAGMASPLADASGAARYDATVAMGLRDDPTTAPLADNSEEARSQAEQANVKSGSHLTSDLADDTEAAVAEAREASHHDAPRSELVDDSEEARSAAMRASEASAAGDKDEAERAEKRET